jgi:hypothetical protein
LELQLELTHRGIPFRVRSGVRFFEQSYVKDVLAHLLVGGPGPPRAPGPATPEGRPGLRPADPPPGAAGSPWVKYDPGAMISLAEGRFPLPAARTPDEERRLFYVAATRARDELALCYPISVLQRGGERAILRLSRFLEELPVGEEAPYARLMPETRTAQDGS